MSLAWSTFLLAEYSFPAFVVGLLDLFLFYLAGYECTLDCDFWSVVAIEEGSVDFDAGNPSGCNPKTNDDPVGGLGIVTPSFPSVVPCTGVDEETGFANGRRGSDEVGGAGEPFVTEREDG